MSETQTLIDGLHERREGLRAEIAKLVETENERVLSESGDSALTLSEPMSADALEKHRRLVAAWDQASEQLRVLEDTADRDRADREKEELLAKAPTERERQAKADAQAVKDLLAAGTGDYRAKRIPDGGTDRTLEFTQPLILRDPTTGRNTVHSTPAVFGNDGAVDEHASWRAAEIIAADRRADFNLASGERVRHAITDIDADTVGSLPEIARDLYRYLIIRNTVAQYCTIIQTAGVNDVNIPRRTTVPKAEIIGNRSNYGQSHAIAEENSGFGYITLRAMKYAFYTGASFEALRDLTPWSLAAQIVEDGGIGLANGMGEHIVNGQGPKTSDGDGSEPTGILKATEGGAQSVTLNKKLAEAFNSSDQAKRFIARDVFEPMKVLDQAYGNAPNLMFLMNFATYVDLVTLTTVEGNPVFFDQATAAGGADLRRRSIGSIPVHYDQNMPAQAATKTAWVFGDLKGHIVRYAGGPRVDRSDQVRFLNDDIVWRFIHHCDAGQIDPNAMKRAVWPSA